MRRYADFTPEAETDLEEAFGWYQEQVPGLGHEFLAAVEKQLEQIVANPRQYQTRHRGVRRAIMKRFPYAVFYTVEDPAVVVLAVEHQSRDPEHWKRRL